MAPSEAVTGLNALAAPIFDASGTLVGIVAIVDSLQFLGEEPDVLKVQTLVEAGRSISESIGFKAGRSMKAA